MQQDFQKCSHEEATQLYTASLDMPSGDSTLEQLLCEVMINITFFILGIHIIPALLAGLEDHLDHLHREVE